MHKSKKNILLINCLIVIFLLIIDQVTKYYAVVYLQNAPSVSIVKDILHLQYLENRGSAFGMLQDQKLFILFTGCVLIIGILWFMIKLPSSQKFNKLQILLAILLAGGIGNIIDRCRLDYVIDFIYFKVINFPIFNFADIYITIALIIICLLIVFHYKEEDFSFLSFKEKKIRKIE